MVIEFRKIIFRISGNVNNFAGRISIEELAKRQHKGNIFFKCFLLFIDFSHSSCLSIEHSPQISYSRRERSTQWLHEGIQYRIIID